MTPRCAIYTRVSTDAQEKEGTSLDTQERACVAYAEQHGWTVVARIRDTASGFSLERPGLRALRDRVHGGQVDVVLAYALDRLSRKQTHVAILVEELEEAEVKGEFVSEKFEDTATGQLLRSVKAFAAEFEREKIAERTMRGKAQRARSGRIPQGTGRGCYGYIYSAATGQRERHPVQALVVQRIFRRYAATRSFTAVAQELNADGIPALDGGRWYPLTVRRVLTNETYTGRSDYRKTQRIPARTGAPGKRHSRVVQRPREEWITVEGRRHASSTTRCGSGWRRSSLTPSGSSGSRRDVCTRSPGGCGAASAAPRWWARP
jgi:site-specific DNA recombinase